MKRVKDSLDNYIPIPEDMSTYLAHNGKHFSKKACEWAVSMMRDSKGRTINLITKEYLNNQLKNYGIKVENNSLYDEVFVYCMCMADFMGSSILDEQHVLLYVKDLIDDADAVDGFIFNRWYADMSLKGEPIDWEAIL